ncbi:MAG: sulfotransferase [Sphingomonadaceae bacterium]|nr:sulfotransferase [Sphingomonadaceae bacterium]
MSSKAILSQRSRLVGAANRALPALYAAKAIARPKLDADAICDGLRRQTGLSDFGGGWFRQPLDILLAALREEASLNQLGHFAAVGQFRKVLKDRLFAQQIFSEHPEIDGRSLGRPVIVVGPMRSGTTRLHRLLASDLRFAHMRSFETINPVPSPDFRPGNRDLRWIVARLAMGAVHTFNPTTAVIHPSGPFEPEEELGLLVRSIWGMKHEAQWQVPSYGRWAEAQDATPAYEYMARLLRLIGWARGEDDSRPWVLKTPQHMMDLPALCRVFPDARIIFTHREPRAVVGSSCSLVWNQMIIHSDKVEPDAIGREWLRKTDLQIRRMREARLAIPERQRIDVRYGDMERDWKGVMGDIYRFLDMDIAPALPAMGSYMASSDRELHRHPHRYSLEAFGLDAGQVSERFESYTDAFELRPRTASPGAEPQPIMPDMPNRAVTAPMVDWDTGEPARAAAVAGQH